MLLSLLIALFIIYIILSKTGVIEKLTMPKGSIVKSSCEYQIVKNDQEPSVSVTEQNEPTAANTFPPEDYSAANTSLTVEEAKFNPELQYTAQGYSGSDNYAAFCYSLKEKGICTRDANDPVRAKFDNEWCKDNKCEDV